MNTKDTEEPLEEIFDDPEDDEMFRQRERMGDRGRPVIGEFVRRAIENTVGKVETTGVAGREAISYLLQQGDKGRREVVRVVAKEVGDFLRATDVSSEVVKVLTRVRLEVNASVSFKPTDDGRSVRPEVDAGSTASVRDLDGHDYLADDEGEETTDLRAPEDPEETP